GTVGRAAAGLALLTHRAAGAEPLDGARGESARRSDDDAPAGAQAADELVASFLRPTPPVALGPAAAAAGAHAMMDVSDGLLRDGGRVASASGVLVDLDTIALAPLVEALAPAAALLGADPLTWVLSGGEDHGLL